MNIHPSSPLGLLERMFETDICVVCLALGGANTKPRNKALCGYHMSKPPQGFRCPNEIKIVYIAGGIPQIVKCRYKQKDEGYCKECGEKFKLVPYWNRMPEGLEFLKGKKKLNKWMYAQLAVGRGKERGLEVLDRIGEKLEIGNGSMILNLVGVAEVISKGGI